MDMYARRIVVNFAPFMSAIGGKRMVTKQEPVRL